MKTNIGTRSIPAQVSAALLFDSAMQKKNCAKLTPKTPFQSKFLQCLLGTMNSCLPIRNREIVTSNAEAPKSMENS
jgi:hypothetical protein